MSTRIAILAAIILLSACTACYAQQDSIGAADKVLNFPIRLFSKIRSSITGLDNQVKANMIKYLRKLSIRERKLEEEVYSKDTVRAASLFKGTQKQYENMMSDLSSPGNTNLSHPLREYIPNLDSLQTAMTYLKSSPVQFSALSQSKLLQIQQINNEILLLEARLQSANNSQQFIAQREQQLKDQLLQLGFSRELSKFNEQAYYYQQQLEEYKNQLKDPKRLEERMLTKLSTVPAFQEFMAKHSYLSELFHLPENYGSEQSAIGLQTKAMIAKNMGGRYGGSGGGGSGTTGAGSGAGSGTGGGQDPGQLMQGQMEAAQAKLKSLQDKVSQLGMGGGGSNSVVMPDFAPNGQKTRTFLKRLQFGYNLQTQRTNSLLPTTTNLGISLGYKLDDKKIIGIGGSYNVGWGNDVMRKMSFSSQGVSIRSFVDVKFKGSWWITGGFEYNYLQQFANFQQIERLDVWQKSALIGLSKKYQITKNKGGNLQLLFDGLYRQHVPPSSPLIVRMGFTL